MASQLRGTDLRRSFELVRRCHGAIDTRDFATRLLEQLPSVIPCETAVLEYMPTFPQAVLFLADPMAALPAAGVEILNAHMPTHPFVLYYQRNAASGAIKLSDFMTRRQLHQTGLYSDLFRHSHPSVEDLMHVQVAGRMPSGVFVSLCRHTRDFNERDRQVLDLLRPHLRQACGNARKMERLRRELDRTRNGLAVVEQGVILTNRPGVVLLATPRARRLGRDYFRTPVRHGELLPESLRDFIRRRFDVLSDGDCGSAPLPPLIINRDTKRLVVTFATRTGQGILLLDEQILGVMPADLRATGLSPREAEVLALVAEGKTNVEIGLLLGARPKTIAKHLERIFQKLGVESRTAAARLVFDLLHRRGVES